MKVGALQSREREGVGKKEDKGRWEEERKREHTLGQTQSLGYMMYSVTEICLWHRVGA